MKKKTDKEADAKKALLVQNHQLKNMSEKTDKIGEALSEAERTSAANQQELDYLTSNVDDLLSQYGITVDDVDVDACGANGLNLIEVTESEREQIRYDAGSLSDPIESINYGDNWDDYLENIHTYGEKHGIDLTKDPFDELLSPTQKAEIYKRIQNEFKYSKCKCDKYDYMLAAATGTVGGLIDAFFVGSPKDSVLGNYTDKKVDQMVEKFAGLLGWDKSKSLSRGSDTTRSAIGFLENGGMVKDGTKTNLLKNMGLLNDNNRFSGFKVNYDHRNTTDVGGAFTMNTKNHHLKSLAHSASPIGLLFSILGQFTGRAYFASGGRLIAIDTKTQQLYGGNLIAKLFCGFINWFGHLVSDVAGSSGATGRGSGIPIPFYELFQFMNIGEIGEYKNSVAKASVKIFEEGYDFRHGLTMAIPVVFTELVIRFIYTIKRRFFHKLSWKESIPLRSNAELRRMLLVGHGSLCLVDTIDAGIRSGFEPFQMLLRMNLVGWVRFGYLGFKEIVVLAKHNGLDTDLMDEVIDNELHSMLSTLPKG